MQLQLFEIQWKYDNQFLCFFSLTSTSTKSNFAKHIACLLLFIIIIVRQNEQRKIVETFAETWQADERACVVHCDQYASTHNSIQRSTTRTYHFDCQLNENLDFKGMYCGIPWRSTHWPRAKVSMRAPAINNDQSPSLNSSVFG